ncbi:unnamed protein product [Didymodactylos carnosus]|uniref:Uncharacterized protein n=1 Tax=Didymodactylos carnosus TaxID=1234261 RepID=A0A814XIC3_9BILA|nr:unnamed protein product [Didymodactylos carnosus]CAF3975519.1 unnamed protein product [Didymodactylos carnosus]
MVTCTHVVPDKEKVRIRITYYGFLQLMLKAEAIFYGFTAYLMRFLGPYQINIVANETVHLFSVHFSRANMLRIKLPSDSLLTATSTPLKNVPLKQVKINSKLRSFAADVTITQLFQNDEQMSIEAVYSFPIEENAAIYSFTAKIDDREIVAQLKEKKEAQREYGEALQHGNGAYLLEQDEKSQDMFIINVGALPAGKHCEIQIGYVTELDLINGNKIRFVVPTTIAPRYNPDQGGLSAPAGTKAQYVQAAPYTVEFKCQIDKLNQQVTQVSSISHPVNVNFSNLNHFEVILSQQSTHLDRDIILDIELAQIRTNTILVTEKNQQQQLAIMTSFTPSEDDCRKALGSGEGQQNSVNNNEFVFVVDCSGSMQDESKIDLARQAMLLFLKSLPVSCRFNIIRFGSGCKILFEQEATAIYNEENVEKAEKLIKQMKADLGGTELLQPLQQLDKQAPAPGHSRQIFLLTDGEISNVDQVMDLCRSMATSSRIFSFGLGHAPSRSLVKGLARSSNGRYVFIPPGSSVDTQVAEQLAKALQPCIIDSQIKWNLPEPVQTIPLKTPPVYANDRLLIYGLVDGDTQQQQFDHNTTVELYSSGNKTQLGLAKIDHIPQTSTDQTIVRLAAKALIRELLHSKQAQSQSKNKGSLQTRFQSQTEQSEATQESKNENTKQIIDLSLKYNILSPHTSFVGVEKRTNGNNSDMVLREVPIQISADDRHLQVSGGGHHMMLFAGSSVRSLNSRTMMSVPTSRRRSSKRSLMPTLGSESDLFDEVDMLAAPTPYSGTRYSDESATYLPATKTSEVWPTSEQDVVRYLIDLQKFDGLWDLTTEQIEKLSGKPLPSFKCQDTTDQKLLSSGIVIVVLEQIKYSSQKPMWNACIEKTRRRLAELLGGNDKLELLLKELRTQILSNA